MLRFLTLLIPAAVAWTVLVFWLVRAVLIVLA